MTAAPQSSQPKGESALLPWRISHTDGSNYALEIVADNKRGSEELVCRPLGKKRDANAALIVDAVNSHSRLLSQAADDARRIAELLHPFRNVDELDWKHLLSFIPDSGHGKFWKAVFAEARSVLTGGGR